MAIPVSPTTPAGKPRTRNSQRKLPPLPAVLAGLSGLSLSADDGYTGQHPPGRPGLGAHAHAQSATPVIGRPSPGPSRPPTRCRPYADPRRAHRSSPRPARPAADATDLVRPMPDQYRLPDALPAPIPAGRSPRSHHDRPPARLTYTDPRNAACAGVPARFTHLRHASPRRH
jgi:hypothetical protein